MAPEYPPAATDLYSSQKALAQRVLGQARLLWSRLSPADFDASWRFVGPRLMAVLTAGQFEAAQAGADSVPLILSQLGIDSPSVAVDAYPFAGVASSGAPLVDVLYEPVIDAKVRVARGSSARVALDQASTLLDGIVLTQIADAGRGGASVGVAARPRVGYVRMLNQPSCARCTVLAGRFYRWSAGFLRHPRCDCRHVPSTEDVAGDLRTSPSGYFRSLPASEQERVFTKAGAQAIRDGADISQVVNARRGMTAASGRIQSSKVFGRDLYLTTEGTSVRGAAGRRLAERGTRVQPSGNRTLRYANAPRLMPESIYQIARGDRDEAVRLLRLNGFIAD